MYICAERVYSGINSIKSPASGAGNPSEPMLMSQSRESARSRVLVYRCISAVRVMQVPVFVCLCSSYVHVTEVGGLKVAMQNDKDLVDVFLLYQSVLIVTMWCGFSEI
jgi:hypothetical protein